YTTYEEAQEAYGYGDINDDELYQIGKALEAGQNHIKFSETPTEIANKMMKEFIGKLESDIRSFRFESLSVEDKEKISKQHEELQDRIRAKRGIT
ncbi:MAG: hypothetical protein WCR87_08860, partial [Saccharofermentanales bacterium]